MTKGKLYGLGVGPGDRELITLKAARILREADIIAVPDKGSGEKTALNIVREHVEGKELLFCPTPMVRDEAVRGRVVEEVRAALEDAGFRTTGVVESPITGPEGNVEYLVRAVYGA